MQVDATETHCVRVPDDVSECDAAGPALKGVHPVAHPWIVDQVCLSAIPDVEAVQRVKSDGQPDAEEFQSENEWQAAEKSDLLRVCGGPIDGRGVGDDDVLEKKCAYRDDAAEGMKPSPEEFVPRAST